MYRKYFSKAVEIELTKRNVLKVIVYDPVGYLQPIIIRLKLLFQEICLLNIGWDDLIGGLQAKWLSIVDELRKFSDIELKRRYYVEAIYDPVDRVYLHGFSDASEMAYGACVYMKSVTRAKNISITLVTAKSSLQYHG